MNQKTSLHGNDKDLISIAFSLSPGKIHAKLTTRIIRWLQAH